jgi:uncharacterized protein YigE (DUF2233 family)
MKPMPEKRAQSRHAHWFHVVLVCLSLVLSFACKVDTLPIMSTATPSPTPTPPITPTPRPTYTPSPTPEPIDTGWQPASPGAEIRTIEVYTASGLERMVIVRLETVRIHFQVLYAQGDPRSLGTWAYESDALLVVNGGYFSEDYTALGLTIANGQTFGSSYGDYAGMFAVTQEGVASVRWLRAWPYNPAEYLTDAVQSFPVLVKPGGIMGFPADADDGQVARRAVVAQDTAGNILFIVAPRGYFSLHELAVWLSTSDLGIDTAMNLDGGPSAGIWMPGHLNLDAMVPVPQVIAVVEH